MKEARLPKMGNVDAAKQAAAGFGALAAAARCAVSRSASYGWRQICGG